jgi:hypothetical protein
MVQIVENHAEVVGELLSAAPDPERPGFVVLTVRVVRAEPVPGSPNFFERDVGQTIPIVARATGGAASVKPGPIRLRVRKSSPGVSFADE